MASTFFELYSDYVDNIKIYTEKLDVTHLTFMRDLSRGMQQFQRRTEYVETFAEITPNSNFEFVVPDDLIRIEEVKDDCGNIMLLQGMNQQNRNDEYTVTGKRETPNDYSMRLDHTANMVSMWSRRLRFSPGYVPTKVFMWYIPDIQAFSSNSAQWESWFPIDTNFDDLFRNASIMNSLSEFEEAFLNYATAKFIKKQGSKNYLAYDQPFEAAVQEAIQNKPLYNREMVGDYFMSPWS